MALRHSLLAVAGAAALFVSPASAQTYAVLPTTCQPGVMPDCVRAIPVVNPDGTKIGGGSGGGGGGDASASNQTLQLTQEQLIAARLGDTTSPTTGSVNARLAALLAALGTPLQTGGSISNITGTVALPTGAATAAKQPALGTAGAASADVLSVQGVANGVPQNVVSKGGGTLVTGQVSVGTTATLIAAARAGRQKIGVTVTSAVQCAFGNAGVTLATGWPLAAVAYASDNWDTAAALYGVCASTATIGYRELNP